MGERRDDSLPRFNKNICIVLVEPEHDGNIGAVARCMMNFGITDLRVVGRDGDWSEETRKRAKNAQEVLDEARLVDTLEKGVSDCSIIIGTSGKREEGEKTSLRHFLLPDELPDRLSDVEGRVAVVFGPEGRGLLNEQLRMCDILVTIPTWEGYPILNLSHAVAIICYSWFINCQTGPPSGSGERLLEPALRERFREESMRLVRSIPTKEHKRKGIEENLIRVVMRGLPKNDEMHRLIGIISEAADSFEREGDNV
ncbi:MAG: RNA methyltransferase [Candidatus Thalassarchaeaceae archaeon]|nr:RNA methyltransferase [Candidatus Thalassarchaeaceae archaeon]